MKKSAMMFLMVLCFAALVNSTLVQAQGAAATEEDKFSFGKVVSVVDGVITVKEYDFAKDADVETGYAVTAETDFGNINAVTDLQAGDDIVIDYIEKEGKRVVTTLVKEEKGMEAMPGEAELAVPSAEVVPAAQ